MILNIDGFLVISIDSELSDKEWVQFQSKIMQESKKQKFRGIFLDISNVSILDSYASNTMNKIIKILKMIGQKVVIIGIQPDVAFSMVQLGITFKNILTALDFEDAKEKLALRESFGT